MKKFNKVMALVLSVAVVLAMSVPMMAFAADSATGSITMDTSADGTVEATGKTFNAYKVLDVTYSGDKYSYTIPSTPENLVSKLATKFEVTEKAADESDNAYQQRIVKAIENAGKADVEKTAKDLLAVAKDAGITPVAITGNTKKSGLALGYYVIEDVTTSGDNQKPVSAVALTTTNPEVTIKVKATKPTLDKKIDEGETTGEIDAKDVQYDNHAVGDKVPYILKSTVPEMTGYNKYFFVVNDTLSKGLTFNDDVVIKITKKAVEDDPATDENEAVAASTRTLVKDQDYTVAKTTNAETGETAVEIVFKDFYNKEKAHAGEEIVITYSATINDDAVIGVEGNPNTAKLVYSNNPNDKQEGTPENPDKPKPGDATGETPDQKTYTYVTGIELLKQDGTTKERLSGAKFKITGTKLNTVLVETESFEKGTGDGYEYYKLKDGSYTKQAPSTAEEGQEGYNADKYESTTDLYKKTVTKTPVVKAENVSYEGTTGEDGVLYFDGLAAGEYQIEEIEAPTGYNPLPSPIDVNITWNAPSGTSTECTWTATGGNVKDGIVQVTIDNNTGTELPSTGGIGTTIFYVLGAILVIGAGVLLVTRRRMNVN